MTFSSNKYRKRCAIAVLAAYLLLVSISILHYHHINIQTGNFEINSTSQNTCNDVFDKIIDITHECTIQHFTETIINYNFAAIFNVIIENGEQNIFINEIPRIPQAPIFNNNPLRAPPFFS
jgi:hypothetical protein